MHTLIIDERSCGPGTLEQLGNGGTLFFHQVEFRYNTSCSQNTYKWKIGKNDTVYGAFQAIFTCCKCPWCTLPEVIVKWIFHWSAACFWRSPASSFLFLCFSCCGLLPLAQYFRLLWMQDVEWCLIEENKFAVQLASWFCPSVLKRSMVPCLLWLSRL